MEIPDEQTKRMKRKRKNIQSDQPALKTRGASVTP
jgi:hypothetical protein